MPLGIALSEKQVPRFIGIVGVEVKDRVRGVESGALQAGGRGFDPRLLQGVCLSDFNRVDGSCAGFEENRNYFRVTRNPSRIDAKRGDHFLQADL
jgi:hypothetical protein